MVDLEAAFARSVVPSDRSLTDGGGGGGGTGAAGDIGDVAASAGQETFAGREVSGTMSFVFRKRYVG